MRLCVIIPAYNEEKSVCSVVASIPASLPGVDDVRIFVVDDGSTDATREEALRAGAIVLSHPTHLGLAAAFRTGLKASLENDADLIATLDADGQYKAGELASLWMTMRLTNAQLVVGDRCVCSCRHMPLGNRIGNMVGSCMLRVMGVTRISDASSGFRLFTANLGASLRIMSRHTYTHEMLIQADAYGFTVAEVPVTFLPRSYGRSKLVRTLRHHILRSCGTIIRSIFLYRPLRKFVLLSALCILTATSLAVYAVYNFDVHFKSMMIAALFAVVGIQFLILGVIAEASAAERRLQREVAVSRTRR